jgi:hypothetical protein
MSRRARRKRTFDYAPIAERKKLVWQQRMAGFQGLVFKAYRGNPDPLIERLQSAESGELTQDDCEWLAWLIERKLPRIGRPTGSVSPKTAATRCASCLVNIGKAAWRKKHGFKRAPTKGPRKAPIELMAKRAIELMEVEFPGARRQIRREDVITGANLEPRREVVEYVADFLSDARREITDIALK